MTKVKLCGFTEKQTLQTAISQKCDFLGFVFCKKSPRFITPQDASNLASVIPANISKVAVVAEADFDLLNEIATKFSPDFFQFHGDENIDFLQKSRQQFPQIKIIKAFKISAEKDLEQIQNFENYADLFLLDGKTAGSGEKFDWKILQNFSCNKEWFLAGGLNAGNIQTALETTSAKLVDISSGIEKVRGQKSPELIAEFMQKIRNLR